MSTYPGNPSLGDEVKQRILATYEQSVGLAESGRDQEAILGCDFVLELDPQFDPARTLKARLSDADGAPAADGSGEGLDALPELPDFSDLYEVEPEPEASADDLFDFGEPAAPAAGRLAAELRERLEARDFRGVLERAARGRDAVASDPEAAGIAETAQSRLEAQPYVESFLREAGTALRAGDLARAEGELAKVRSLDPDHPLFEDMEARLRSARGEPAPPPAAPAPPPPASSHSSPFDLPEDDDMELLGGFDVPDLDTHDEPPSWSPEPTAAGGAEEDDDLFSFDGLEPSDAPQLDPAPAPAAAAAEPSRPNGDSRIADLLAEGDEASAAGDHQGAIDAWSRIFLIDVDHDEAARRIEAARRQKAEREREVEEAFHEGLAALEAGDRDRAKARFERVLELQSSHLAARDYLRQIESGEPVSVSRGPSPDETIAMGGLGTFDLSDLSSGKPDAADSTLREEILVPPPPSESAGRADGAPRAVPSYGPAQAKREPGRRSFLLVGGLVLVLVAAAGWWLFSNKDSVFPNSDAEEVIETAPAEVLGPIERATDLHEQGRTSMALAMLRRIRPDDPSHAEAQELIARWEAPAEADAEGEPDEEALPPEALERRERILQAARTAYEQQEYLFASQLFDRAARISALDGEPLELQEATDRALEPLAPEVAMFESGDYLRLLPRLWRLYEEEPGNRDVRRMMITSYYNRGIRELQRGDAAAAAEEFEEALAVAPDDEELQRHYLFAETYQSRSKDLLYRIYVKYLPTR